MHKTPRKSELDNLLQSEKLPTIGELVSSSNEDYKNWRGWGLSKTEYCERMWEGYDKAFGHRADYRLWRILFRSYYLSALSKAWVKCTLLSIAEDGIESREPVIVWGMLAVMSGLLTRSRGGNFDQDQLLYLADLSNNRMFEGLAPIRNGEAGCGVIKVLTLDAIQKIRSKRYGPMAYREVDPYLSRLEKYLREIDLDWKLGDALSLEALRQERMNGRIVVPFIKDAELLSRVVFVFFNARAVVRDTLRDTTEETNQLLVRAALFAFSAWRTMRSLRIGEEKWQTNIQPRYPELNLDKLFSDEMHALRRTSQALLDAGYNLLSAGLGHLLLRVIPDHILRDPRFKGLGDDISFWIRQAGLEVDERFRKRPDSLSSEAPKRDVLHHEATGLDIPGDENLRNNVPLSSTQDPFRLRLVKDQKIDPRWALILRTYGSNDPDPVRSLISDARKDQFIELEALHSAYSLSLEYGHIDRATEIIKFFPPTKLDLVDLAHSMKRALQVMPFGMDIKKHHAWQTILRNKWSLLSETESITEEEALVIHEILLGRYLSIVLNVGPEGAKLVSKKYYNLLSEEEIRAAFDARPQVIRGGPATITRQKFHEFILKISDSELGSPVCLSIVSLGGERWSIFAAAESDRWIYQRPYIGNLLDIAKKLCETHKLWFRRNKNQEAMLGIPWGQEFTRLGRILVEIVKELNPKSRWLILAVEPDLATLPWQNLVQSLFGEGVLISLIPSFGWGALRLDRKDNSMIGLSLLLSDANDLAHISTGIRNDEIILGKRLTSAAVILGHGKWTTGAGGLPYIDIATTRESIDLEEWLRLAEHRLAVVHSCYGGRVEHRFLGDLGRLPGLFLGISCQLFCSPVAEVSPATAWVLHSHLIKQNGPREFGLRYLAALTEDPSVALYNLYGLANIKLD